MAQTAFAAAPDDRTTASSKATPPGTRGVPSHVEDIQVTAQRHSAANTARARLASVPGGTSVVDQTLVQKGRVFTDQDVLAFQPGVYAQSSGGGDGLKISVRGSGLQNGANYFRQGIYILFDGMPVTGPGGTPYELFEPLGLDYTEVLRGANAFDAGAVDLGGAINYVTKTGHDALLGEVRVEAGSFGYTKEQISSGKVIGPFDYYISLTNSYRSGYQQQSRATARGVVANFGYEINPAVTTRFFFRWRQTENEYPGYLTVAQIATNPRQAQAPYYYGYYGATRIQPGSTWVGNKTTIRLDDKSTLDISELYHNYPIDIRSTNYDAVWGYDDFTESVQYTRHDLLFGRESDWHVGAFSTTHIHGFQNTSVRIPTGALAGLTPGTLLRRASYEGSDNNFHIGNDTNIWNKLWLTSGLSVVYDRRGTDVTIPVTGKPALYTEALNLAPRTGLRYVVAPHVQVFGNVSRTVEPPNDWEYLSGNATNSNVYKTGPLTGLVGSGVRLRNETALTWEIGTSGEKWGEAWSVSYYHSDVRNELLNVSTAASLAAGISNYGNASPTTHQGVETSLDSTLWQTPAFRLWLRQAYTYSQFNFKHDSIYGQNQLPGVPKHFYQGQVRLDLHDGLYASFEAQAASGIPIDYANTAYTHPYHTLGTTIGWDDTRHHREVFLNFSNLTDTHYAAIVSPTANLRTTPGAYLQPGDGFGVFAGVSYGFE